MPMQNSVVEFDIPTFIKNEAERLQNENPTITKTVTNEKSSEVKQTKISNWNNELAHFATVNLNKSGNSDFLKERIGDTLIFSTPNSSKNSTVVKVIYQNDTPTELQITKITQNLLFVNEEHLFYSKGKTYSITKNQHVKGMGTNNYIIKGDF